LLTATFVIAAAVLSAGSAGAHEEISPPSLVTGKPAFLTLAAANEKQVDLVSISLAAPTGAPFGGSTRQAPGWVVQRDQGSITWSGGSVKPEGFDEWGFEVEGADQPGQLQYKVTLGFAGGQTETSDVVVDAVAPGEPTTSPTVGTAVTSAPAAGVSTSVGTPGGAQEAVASTKSTGSGKANTALTVAIVSGIVAVAALALAARRRSTPSAATGASPPDQDF